MNAIDQRPGACLCCNAPVHFNAKEWAEKATPAVACPACYQQIRIGAISTRELRMLYTMRSQIGYLFQEVAVLKTQMQALCEAQAELQKAYFDS